MKKFDIKYLLAWAIPSGVMFALFIINGIYPFGERSFLTADLYHQYMPFLQDLSEKVRSGAGLDYDWTLGVGSNFMALYVYYLASPLHWLMFLFPAEHVLEFLSYMAIIKVGLCGLTCCIYLRKHFRTDTFATVLFSCFYALSGWMCAYNYNIMWLDCVILLPLILLGLERLVKEGRWMLYCAALALSILTNYYISIMICIFLVIYFLVLYLTEGKGIKPLWQFAGCSLLAGGLAAVLLIPEVCAILVTDFGHSSFPETLRFYFPVLEELARHCLCVTTEKGLEHWPNIYCGAAAFLFIPMYVLNERIPEKRRFASLFMVGFLLLGFSTNMLDFLWHGYNYPDSLPARQSFIYILLVITMCFEVFMHVKEMETRHILYGYLAAVVFLLCCEMFITDDAFDDGIEILTLIFVTLYAVLLHYYRVREEADWQRAIAVMAALAVVLELGINTYNTSLGTTNRSQYMDELEDYRSLYREARVRTQGFFRIEKFTRKTKNDGTLAGYPTASLFSSTLNSNVADLYERLGMRHSKVYYCFDGATAFTSALLNVQYMFGDTKDAQVDDALAGEGLYTALDTAGDITLYADNYTLPFGYVVPAGYDLPEGHDQEPLRLQNHMVRMLGVEDEAEPWRELFEEVSCRVNGDDIVMTVPEDGYYYMVVTASGTAKVDAKSPNGTKKYADLKDGCVLYVGYLEEDELVTFTNGDENDETPGIKLDAYRLDLDMLREVLDVLSEQHLTDVAYDDAHVSGHLSLAEAGRLVLSIPYEAGWTVMVNGVETQASLFGECLIALDLQAGEYEIELSYVPWGKGAGLAVSVVSLAVLGLLLLIRKRHKV